MRILSISLAMLFAISLANLAFSAEEAGSMATPAPVKKDKMSQKKQAPTTTPAPENKGGY